MISGRIVAADRLYIDTAMVLTIVDGGEQDGQFGLVIGTTCDACDSNGYLHGRRCDWCKLHEPAAQTGAEYMTFPELTLSEGDMVALGAWAALQQIKPTWPGNAEMAGRILVAIRAYRVAVGGADTQRSGQVAA